MTTPTYPTPYKIEPMPTGAAEQLAILARLEAAMASLLDQKQAAADAALPADVAARLAEINAEYAPALDALEADIEVCREAVKQFTLAEGKTVTVDGWQAVFNKGRVSWNNDKLMGYGIIRPEVMAFQTVGEPSVSIRRAK